MLTSTCTLPATLGATAYTPWPSDTDPASQSGPRFFGPAAHPLFGWYHAPVGQPRGEAVVLCPSIGLEYMTGHRALRTLAEQLSDDGFAVLRFDWPGTGDSAGDAGDPNCPTATLTVWRAALAQAVERVRAWSGSTRVSVIGLRGGASLAAAAGPAIGVSRVVLWWPATSGRQLLRELRAQHAMSELEHDRYASPNGEVKLATGSVEMMGFVLAPGLARELGALTFTADPDATPLAAEALVVAPEQASESPVAAALVARGVRVDARRAPGHEAMRTTALWAALPASAIAEIAGWLRGRAITAERDGCVPHVVQSEASEHQLTGVQSTSFNGVRETCVRFGRDARVAGVLTEPDVPLGGTAGAPEPVLLLHTGADHHVGPNRLWPVWARQWARAGVSTLRFDPAGIGDTPALPGEETTAPAAYDDGRTAEVVEAAAYLCERTGADRVVLVGICSGAYYAVQAAGANGAVARVIAVNPQFYADHTALDRTAVAGHRAPALLGAAARDPQRWRRLFRGETSARGVARMVGSGAGHAVRAAAAVATQEARALTTSRRRGSDGPLADLWRMSAARVPCCLVFSQEDEGWAYLRVQARAAWRAYRRRHRTRVRVLERADHTFMRAWMQHRLYEVVTDELHQR